MLFPSTRMRRNRQAPWIRNLVQETTISVNDLILPLFITPEKSARKPIKTMPGIDRLGLKELISEVKEAKGLGINAVALFPVVPSEHKDASGNYALNKNNFLFKAISEVKSKIPDMGIICDVALDPYTSHGHDGVLNMKGLVDNDRTNEMLCKQALTLAKAGSDYVAPSDMMDGRVGVIRKALDGEGYIDTGIISYSVKYASSLYSAFRDAVGSAKNLGVADKKNYQMNPANIKEAIIEAKMDIHEGADILMVKPGIFYLDVLSAVSQAVEAPVFTYQVGSEYSMIKNSALAGVLNYDKVLIESMVCFKRAGASAIFTYAAKDVARILNDE